MEVEPAAETDDKPRWVPSAENAFFHHLIKEAADLLDQFPPRLLVVLSLMKDVEGSFLLKRNSATLVPY